MAEWKRFGPTSRYSMFFDCYAGEVGPGEPLEAQAAAERLYAGMYARERPVALIIGADSDWPYAQDVALRLVQRTADRMMRLESGDVWMGVVLEVGRAGRDMVNALDGALDEDAYRVCLALQAGEPTLEQLKGALLVARSRLQLIVNLYDDADASELARFQRTIERAAPLKGRGVLTVGRP